MEYEFCSEPANRKLIGLGLALGASPSLSLTAKTKEKEDIQYFGEAYRAYQKRTKMFIPFVF
ncbi:MAG: hypothetical protein J5I94_02175 [Phaeodactylibacter sp.]|nr:hypothetical protein [Phaeodactylibacter sp.]